MKERHFEPGNRIRIKHCCVAHLYVLFNIDLKVQESDTCLPAGNEDDQRTKS